MKRLKPKAREAGLWNLFLPPSPDHDDGDFRGAGLTNLLGLGAVAVQHLHVAGIGRRAVEHLGGPLDPAHLSEVFNCSAPDTGNMEVLHRYGTKAQKERWLTPLMAGSSGRPSGSRRPSGG
jgi:acyl-CoA dehydrogenase